MLIIYYEIDRNEITVSSNQTLLKMLIEYYQSEMRQILIIYKHLVSENYAKGQSFFDLN